MSTTGTDLDPDGYQASLSFRGQDIDLQGTARWTVGAGQHQLTLNDVAKNCAVQGEHPRAVTVSAGSVTRVSMEIVCGALPILKAKIVFARVRSESPFTFDLFVMDSDGSGLTQLTDTPDVNEGAAEISPDGKRIVFHRWDARLEVELATIQSDGGEETPLGRGIDPTWSPDGERIAFSNEGSRQAIRTISLTGGAAGQLTDGNSRDGHPNWSPDGAKIVFFRSPPDDLFVMNSDGTGIQQLTHEGGNAQFEKTPRWSPDGAKIAYRTDADGNNEIYVINADGTGRTNLTNNPAPDDGPPSWSPDGSKIVFVSTRNRPQGFGDIWVMNSDGSGQTNLSAGAATTSGDPHWGR